MRIFTRKAFQFKNSDGEKITTSPLGFKDVPDWVAKDPLFLLAQKDGSAEIVDGSTATKKTATSKKTKKDEAE
jgi:hypothetical protein